MSSEVVRVVFALRTIAMPLPRRDAVVGILAGLGFSPMLAQWMTTNLRAGPDGFVWRFDLDGIEAMLTDYARVDAWPWLENPARRARVDVVRAERSERWDDAEVGRFAETTARLHVLPDAAHWAHVDNPDGLHALLLREGV